MPDFVLEVSDVRKRYGATVALDGVSLAVEAGEVFGLLGPNGAGKTTLLSIAAGLARFNGGGVKLFGRPFTRDDRDLRRLVGIGTQDLSIYPDLTARENLRFFGKLYGFGGKELNTRVDDVLTAVGLMDRADDRAGTFSGGMKRRLNLAAAVVHGPKLLFLDEPTAGVDPQSRNHIFEQVKALNATGMTIIYTSHYMEEVQVLCPRIAILDGGKLRACDTLPNLLKRLDATIRVTTTGAPADFADRLAALPGVKRVAAEEPAPLPEGKGECSWRSPVLESVNPPRVPRTPPGAGEGGESEDRVRGEPSARQELRGSSEANAPSPGGEAPPPSPAPGGVRGTRGGFTDSSTGEGKTNSPPFREGLGVGSSFALVVDDIGPVLAKVATACAAAGADLTAVTTSEPTLERVFLHLTGRALRD